MSIPLENEIVIIRKKKKEWNGMAIPTLYFGNNSYIKKKNPHIIFF